MKKDHISLDKAQNAKKNATLFSPTFEIEEKIVVILFCFELNLVRYEHFYV